MEAQQLVSWPCLGKAIEERNAPAGVARQSACGTVCLLMRYPARFEFERSPSIEELLPRTLGRQNEAAEDRVGMLAHMIRCYSVQAFPPPSSSSCVDLPEAFILLIYSLLPTRSSVFFLYAPMQQKLWLDGSVGLNHVGRGIAQ